MSQKNRCLAVAAVTALLCAACAADAQIPAKYSITDLGTLANSTINPTGVNASGVVVGYSNVPTLNSGGILVSSPHAFKTGPNGAGGAQDMGLMPYLPGTVAGTYARGINDSGLIVGYGTTAVPAASSKANFNHAFTSNGTTFTDIGTLGPSVITLSNGVTTANNSIAYGVSNSGYVTGYGTNAQNGATTASTFHAFRFNSKTETSLSGSDDLGVLTGGTSSYGYAVNNAGTVVGRSTLGGTTDYHAFRNTLGGSMQDLGSLGGNSEALAINSAGTMVGDSYTLSGATGVQQAFRLTTNENGITAADRLFPGTGAHVGTIGSVATGINDEGLIVGYYNVDTTLSSYVYHAFLYGNQGYDVNNYAGYDLNNYLLNGAGWTLQYAYGINSVGQITGYGTINGATHAFLLTPFVSTPNSVPEPGSLSLCGGLFAVGATLMRRRRLRR
jgi:probable HAF family extracellular repeat protein